MPRRAEPGASQAPPVEAGGDSATGHPLATLDAVIHAPARLMIATHLFVVEAADAVFLRNMTGLTWGNLSAHLRKLEQAGYVAVSKSFEGRKPKTVLSLTEQGREALLAYRESMLRSLQALD